MKYIINRYFDVCKNEFSQYGYKRKGYNFVRVRNDVMQNFILKNYRLGRSCTIEFGIVPLCMRIEKLNINSGIGIYNLRRFESIQWVQWDRWDYDPNSEENMDTCISDMISHINKYLIPLFNKADSCKNAYPELCELDRLFYSRWMTMKEKYSDRYNTIRENGQKFYKNGINMLDTCKYYMALKNGDYNQAVAHLKAFEKQNIDAYITMLEEGHLTDEYNTKRERKIDEIRKMIETIEAKDEKNILKLIEENEEYSRKNMKGIIRTRIEMKRD